MHLPTHVRITEVGPRDGLQNECRNLATADKIALIRQLAAAGCREIEATAFVSPKAIPNLADAAEVMRGTAGLGITRFALVPNAKGYARALDAGADGVTLVMSATDSHNRKNLNQTMAESMAELAPLAERARADGLAARLSVSMVFGCPFEGATGIDGIRAIVARMADHGYTRIGLCDTIGIADPRQVHDWMRRLSDEFAGLDFELHLHDTYGRGLANALAGLAAGVTRFDSAVGGLGGCPYAPGATGNVSTEDLVAMLDASGVATGLDVHGLLAASDFLARQLDTRIASRRWQVHHAQRPLRQAA